MSVIQQTPPDAAAPPASGSTWTIPAIPTDIQPLASELVAAAQRHVLTAIGGYLISHGLATQSQSVAICGGLTALAGVAWSWLQKMAAKRQATAAAAQHQLAGAVAQANASNTPLAVTPAKL